MQPTTRRRGLMTAISRASDSRADESPVDRRPTTQPRTSTQPVNLPATAPVGGAPVIPRPAPQPGRPRVSRDPIGSTPRSDDARTNQPGNPRITQPNPNEAPVIPPPQGLGPAVGSTSAAEIAARLMGQDSPLMQRADAQGRQFAASRGLLNSSMAGQASQAAMLDQIVPLASQDADINARIQSDERTRLFTATQAGLDRTAATGLANLNNTADMNQQRFVADAAAIQADLNRTAAERAEALRVISDRATQVALANIELRDSDRRSATTMIANAHDVYASTTANIMNNPDLPAVERNRLLAAAATNLGRSINYTRSLYGAAFNWPTNPWTVASPGTPRPTGSPRPQISSPV